MPVTRSKRKAAAAAASPPATPPKPAKTAKTAKTAKAAKRATTAESDRPALETPRCSHHLVKSEPESRLQNGHEMKFSIDDLMREPAATAHWDGVRNFEARNCIKRMKKGDLAFFYHSNTKKSRPSIVGIVEVVKEAYPDHTAEDPKDPHYDAKHTAENPRWFMVDVKLLRRFYAPVTLDDIKAHSGLADMQLVKRGRISVQDVTDEQWSLILDMAAKLEK